MKSRYKNVVWLPRTCFVSHVVYLNSKIKKKKKLKLKNWIHKMFTLGRPFTILCVYLLVYLSASEHRVFEYHSAAVYHRNN